MTGKLPYLAIREEAQRRALKLLCCEKRKKKGNEAGELKKTEI